MKMMRRKNWFGVLGITLFFICTPGVVHADFLAYFHPYAIVEETYSSNLDLTHENEIDDFITSLFAGLRFSYPPRPRGLLAPVTRTGEGPYGIDLDYRLGYNFFAKESHYNYWSQEGSLNAWYALTPRLTFRVWDYLIRSEEPREREYSSEAIEGEYLLGTTRGRPVYFRNVFEPSCEYQFGEEDFVSLNYRNNIYKNQSDLYEDSQENYISPRMTYWFDIRNGIYLEYGLTFGDFERTADLIGHEATGRYTFRFNPRTSIFGEYTYLKRDFDTPSLTETPLLTAIESIDYDAHNPSLGMQYAFSPTLLGRVQVGYYWYIPKVGKTDGGITYDISLTKTGERTIYTLASQGGYTEDFYTAEPSGFVKFYRVIGTITHQLTERISVGVSSSYDWSEDNLNIVEETWESSGDISYRLFDWLLLTLVPSYRQNWSDILVREYKEYRGMFRMTATY
jgi:hypothetical protein